MSASGHPDDETLGQFVLGRLDRRSMSEVESHLRRCSECARIGMGVPDDPLVGLLRNCADRSVNRSTNGDSVGSISAASSPRSASG
jgi:hypothetical protein